MVETQTPNKRETLATIQFRLCVCVGWGGVGGKARGSNLSGQARNDQPWCPVVGVQDGFR